MGDLDCSIQLMVAGFQGRSSRGFGVGMFPLLLTVLNRDCNAPMVYYKGEHPKFRVLEL